MAGLALTGCGRDGEEPTAERPADGGTTDDSSNDGSSTDGSSTDGSSASRPSATPRADIDVPSGVTLTDPGAQLSYGETARVAYEVRRPAEDGAARKGAGSEKRTAGTVLALTVDSVTKGQLSDLAGFNLTDPYQRKANYYYVRVTVKNAGERRFGDVDVPLWGISGENTLLPPVRFTSAFARCPTEPLPVGFAPGARFQTCLVFLSPDKGSFEGVSYRPTEEVTPIEWHGKVRTPRTDGGKADRRGRSRDGG